MGQILAWCYCTTVWRCLLMYALLLPAYSENSSQAQGQWFPVFGPVWVCVAVHSRLFLTKLLIIILWISTTFSLNYWTWDYLQPYLSSSIHRQPRPLFWRPAIRRLIYFRSFIRGWTSAMNPVTCIVLHMENIASLGWILNCKFRPLNYQSLTVQSQSQNW